MTHSYYCKSELGAADRREFCTESASAGHKGVYLPAAPYKRCNETSATLVSVNSTDTCATIGASFTTNFPRGFDEQSITAMRMMNKNQQPDCCILHIVPDYSYFESLSSAAECDNAVYFFYFSDNHCPCSWFKNTTVVVWHH